MTLDKISSIILAKVEFLSVKRGRKRVMETNADLNKQVSEAYEEWQNLKLKDAAEKERLKKEKFEKLSVEEQRAVNNSTKSMAGLRFVLFVFSMTFLLFAWDMWLKDIGMNYVAYIIISFIVAIIFSAIVASCFNKSKKTKSSITPKAKEYLEFCKQIDKKEEGEEVKNAEERYLELRNEKFINDNKDMIFISAPTALAEDSITQYKRLELYIDGKIYSEMLRPGVTKIRVSSDYHQIRFVSYVQAKNSEGVVAGWMEGGYGSSSTMQEILCEIDMSNRNPAGIVLMKKEYRCFNDLTLAGYEKFFK